MGLFGRKPDNHREVIDLTAATEAEPAVREPPRQQWGRPGPCPMCGGRGYLEHIDVVDRVMYQKCLECGHHWELTEEQIRIAAQ